MKTQLPIYIDDRENIAFFNALKLEIPHIKRKRLEIGDITFANVVIERKDADDFLNSLLDRRISKQLHQMKDAYEHRIFIVTGNLLLANLYRKRPLNINILRGRLATIPLSASLLQTEDDYGFIYTVISLYKSVVRRRSSKEFIFLDLPKKTKVSPKTLVLTNIGCFPSIGGDRAIQLLEHFGSLEKLYSADIRQLKEAGLGKTTATKIYKLIRTDFSEV